MVVAFLRHFLNSVRAAVRQPNAKTAVKRAVFVVLVSVGFVSGVAGVFSYTRGGASAAASSTLNFQGRLLNSTGSPVADGSYNIEFNLYTQQAPGGTTQWTEDYLVSNTQGVIVRNGYFSVQLGSVNAFPGTINWDQQQFLGMTVRGTGSCAFGACTPADGEMTPRFTLTAVPYSFRAGRLMDSTNTNAFTADDLIQKAPGTPQVVSAAVAALRLNQTGAGGLLQLQNGGTDVFTVGNDGAVLAKNKTDSSLAFDVQDSVGNSYLKVDTLGATGTFGSSAGAAATVLQAGTGGVSILSGANVTIGTVDGNATLLVLDTKNTPGDPTGTNGAMYYNSSLNKFRCYENGAWVDCIGGSQSTTGTQSFVSGLQNVAANANGTAVEMMVFTSATAVSNVAGVTGFTAPAAGSFRSCLIKDNAAITAGTLALRWRVNGVSVGSPVCNMDATTNRQSAGVLNPGVVTFNAGDTIGIAFDTNAGFLPTGSNDFTVYWSVDYGTWGGGGGSSTPSMQTVYNNSLQAQVITTNNKSIEFQLADTTTDSNFNINIASGSTGHFAVQSNGVDKLTVDSGGNVVAAGGLTVGNSTSTTAGTIRWTGTDFEGFNGTSWQSLTAGSGGGAGAVSVHKVKPNNGTSANNTFTNDPDLNFSIGANESYTFRFVVNANVNATPDIKFAVTAPTGATCNYGYEDVETAAGVSNLACGVSTGLVTGNTADDVYEIVGSIRNGSTPGTVQLQWSQNTTNAGTPITVYAGSYVDAYQTVGSGSNGQPFVQGGNALGGTTGALGTSDASDLSLITNGSDRLHITTGGNVGIGAGSSPSALLSVGTSSAFQVNAAGNIQTTGTLSVQGLSTFTNNIVGGGAATATTGTTIATPGSNTTTVSLTAAGSFANNDVIYIDNAGQDYYTRIVSGAGTTTLTVSPAVSYDASAPVTKYTVQNIGATATDYSSLNNRFFQGYFLGGVVVGAGSTTLSDGGLSRTAGDIMITPGTGGILRVNGDVDATSVTTVTLNVTTVNATTITGDGSGLTNINGASIAGASIADGSLSSNVALLTGAQTFTGAKAFSAAASFTAAGTGLSVTNDATIGGTLTVNNGVNVTGTFTAGGPTNLNGNTTIGNASTDRLTLTSQVLGATAISFQGATDDGNTTSFNIVDPTGANTINVPNASGTMAVSASGNIALDATGNLTLTGQVPIANGGTGAATAQAAINNISGLSVAGDLLYFDGTNTTRLARGTNGQCLTSNATSLAWGSCTTGAVTTIGAIDGGTYSANGASISGSTIYMQTADGTHTGLVNSAAQNIGGVKTFVDGLTLTTGKTLTINGDALTDLTGIGLTNASGALSVSYGSAAGTAVQGNTSLVCASGSGNLSGGGNTITLGSGGTCGAISISNSPTFTTSVTSPSFTGAAAVTLSSGGTSDLTLDSASNILILSDATLRRTAAGTTALQLNDTANTTFSITNTDGTAVAGLSVEGGVTAASFSGDGNALTNLNAANLTGTINDARLSSNVVLLTGGQTISGLKTFSGGLTISSGQTFTVNGDGFTDLTGTGLALSSGALSVSYGSTAGTAVQGNTTLVCPSGSGNLTGGGSTITLGSGGTCGAISTNNAVSFTTSVTTPIIANATSLAINSPSLTTNATNLNVFGSTATTVSAFGAATALNIGNSGGTTTINGAAAVSGTTNLNGNTTIGNATTDRLTLTSQITGANALNFQGATDNSFSTTFTITDPTANRTITVPDDSGILTLIGPSAAQVDAGTNSSLNINKTGASGNILTLSKSGTGVFTVGNTGAVAISTTSTSALVVNNAGGTLDYFSVDSSGGIVQIGSKVEDTVGVLLVLDSKSTTGDPTGQEGAQYYNSAYGTFRCYQGARGWTDCIGVSKPNNRRTTRIDYQGSGTAFAGQGDISTQTASTLTAIAATTAEPAAINQATSGTNGNVTSISGNLNYSSSNTPMFQTYAQVLSTASERIWIGMTNQTSATMGASANPAGNYAAFRYDTSVAGETTWKCITKNNATQTISDSGITVSAAAGYKFEISETSTHVIFKINNVIVCDNTTNLPTANTMMRYSIGLTNLAASTHSLRVAWIFLDTDF